MNERDPDIPVDSELVCLRKTLTERYPIGVATIGNSLRGDDNIAARVCDTLPGSAFEHVCRYDLGTYTSFLGECLRKHKAAIILDATENDTTAGAISIVDMKKLLKGNCNIKISSSHGFSFLDELRMCHQSTPLPDPFFFFGIEANSVEWSDHLSDDLEAKLPWLAESLNLLIDRTLEMLEEQCTRPV